MGYKWSVLYDIMSNVAGTTFVIDIFTVKSLSFHVRYVVIVNIVLHLS
jgi:hypothetical protein